MTTVNVTEYAKLETPMGSVLLSSREWENQLFGKKKQYVVSGKIEGKAYFCHAFLKEEFDLAEQDFYAWKTNLENASK